MTDPNQNITICVEMSDTSATDWKLYINDGKKILRDILGRNPKNIHWIPNPEIVRLHRAGQANVFKLAERYFELETAAGAAASAGWTFQWRFVDKQGNPIQTAA